MGTSSYESSQGNKAKRIKPKLKGLTMFNLSSESLTAQRHKYVSGLLESIVNTAAADLIAGNTAREIAVPAVAKIVTAVVPNTGKGHADTMRAQVESAIDSAMEAMQEAPEEETKGKKEKA